MHTSKLLRLPALLIGVVLVASACGEGADEAAAGGKLVWAHEQEPPDLHVDDPNNSLGVTSWIRSALIEGLFGISRSIEYYPELLAAEPALTVNDDDTVTIDYTLRDGLTWSDGTPLTAADVSYTHNILVEGCPTEDDGSIVDGDSDGCVYLIGDRVGLDLVTGFEVVDDTNFTVTMASFYAGWRNLYREVYAEHAYGANAAEVNANLAEWRNGDGVLPSSGPMVFGSWSRGESLTMTRNENYHGSNSPDALNKGVAFVSGVTVLFVADSDSQINALLAGEAQVIMAQPQLNLERLVESPDFTVAAEPGPVFEHWGLNLLNPHLSKPEVREALLYTMDKSQVMAGLYTPLFGDALPAEGLGNVYWLSNSSNYVDAQAAYAGPQVNEAKTKLEDAGYVEGADGIYAHPEDGRLSLRVGTTGGNALREQQQELLQQQFKAAGIDITIDNVPGGAYFSERPYAEEAILASTTAGTKGDPTIWDITQFGHLGRPWPGGQSGAFRSGSRNNPYGYHNDEFDKRAVECDATVDDAERADCYNDLNLYVTTLEKGDDGLFILPLTQKPSFYGFLSSQLTSAGVAPDAPGAGPLANVVDFKFKPEVAG